MTNESNNGSSEPIEGDIGLSVAGDDSSAEFCAAAPATFTTDERFRAEVT